MITALKKLVLNAVFTNVMKLTTSIVIFNPNMDDLGALFASYMRACRFVSQHYKIDDSVYIIDNNPVGEYRNNVELLCQQYHLSYHYLQSVNNGGYGCGHNQAINVLTSDFHIICNPDIEFYENTIYVAIKEMQDKPDLVLLSPAVVGKDGKRQYLCKRNPRLLHLFLRRFSPTLINNLFFKQYLARYEYRDKDYNKEIMNIPFCTGCFMFFRTQTLNTLNGFDERFFMYLEDADISRRALQFGLTLYLPTFKVIHRWERGSYKNKKLRNEAIKSAIKYSMKWFFKR